MNERTPRRSANPTGAAKPAMTKRVGFAWQSLLITCVKRTQNGTVEIAWRPATND